MFAQVLPIITLDDWIGSDAATAEDGGGRVDRPVTGGAMSTTGEEHYPQDSILFLEEMWGDGFLSPGGPEEVCGVCCPGWMLPASINTRKLRHARFR